MSSRQRKRPGGAADSTPARKRSRLLPSSAGGTSQTELIDREQSGAPAFEPEVIGLTGEDIIDLTGVSSEPEVIIISDDESDVDTEQSQQQQHLCRSSEYSAKPLARDDEEEPREDDGAQPAGPATTPAREDEGSEVQDKEESQQYPLDSREAENSAELGASDNEEEPRDTDDSIDSSEWPDRFESPPTWQDDITDDSEESLQYPSGSRLADSSLELLESNLQQEPRDIEFEPPEGLVSTPNWEDDNAELFEVYGQEMRNVTLNSQEQVDGSGNGTGANDAPVADSAPAEQGSEEEDTESSDAQQGVVIRCPICMDFYSEIMQHGRQLVATMCGHVFCSRCLPVALETVPICPACRVELAPRLYIPIYL